MGEKYDVYELYRKYGDGRMERVNDNFVTGELAGAGSPNLPNAAVTLAIYNPGAIRADEKHPDPELADLVALSRRYLTLVFKHELKEAENKTK